MKHRLSPSRAGEGLSNVTTEKRLSLRSIMNTFALLFVSYDVDNNARWRELAKEIGKGTMIPSVRVQIEYHRVSGSCGHR